MSRYADEKLMLAVRDLAMGDESIQGRVGAAYVYQLIHLNPKDFSDELRPRFEALIKKLEAVRPRNDEGSIEAISREMSSEDAKKAAEEIFSLYLAVADEETRP